MMSLDTGTAGALMLALVSSTIVMIMQGRRIGRLSRDLVKIRNVKRILTNLVQDGNEDGDLLIKLVAILKDVLK